MKRLFSGVDYRFDGEVIPDVTRDDLIRLVVGMQWAAAMVLFSYDAVRDDDGYTLHPDAGWSKMDLRSACDIVDEWLGVRK
jgi:hypothetical protein